MITMENHILVKPNREIVVPEELKNIAVQFDHNIETVTFDCPRYWDGIDMSGMKVYINYMRPDGYSGSYLVDNVTVDDKDNTTMHFDWTISRNVTEYRGSISFLICIKKVDVNGNEVNHWNSQINKDLKILEGLECGNVIINKYPDLITSILQRLGTLSFVKCTQAVYDAIETPDPNIIYYAVDDNGKVTQYLGSAKLTSGNAPVEAIVCVNGIDVIFGAVKEEE